MPKTKAKPALQLDMEAIVLEDDEVLETLLRQHRDYKSDEERKRLQKHWGKVKRQLAERCDSLDLEEGQQYRVGDMLFTVKARAGGGFSIDRWERKVLDTVTDVNA